MSKRKRKSRRYRTPNLPGQSVSVRQSTKQKQVVDLAEEYAYVVADLGRIALLAAIMMVGLFVLSLILHS